MPLTFSSKSQRNEQSCITIIYFFLIDSTMCLCSRAFPCTQTWFSSMGDCYVKMIHFTHVNPFYTCKPSLDNVECKRAWHKCITNTVTCRHVNMGNPNWQDTFRSWGINKHWKVTAKPQLVRKKFLLYIEHWVQISSWALSADLRLSIECRSQIEH